MSPDAHVSNPICIPSASDHPPSHPCNVCLPHRSPSAHEPPVPSLSLGLTLHLLYEQNLSVPPHQPWVPQYQPPLSRRPWLPQRAWPLSSLSQSSLCPFPLEGCAQPLPSLLLSRLQPCALHPLGYNPCSPHGVDHPACNPTPAHPSPEGPGGPRWRQHWQTGSGDPCYICWSQPLPP